MRRAELLYVLTVEACVLALSIVAGSVFWYLHGPIPAVRMLAGTFLLMNMTLIWVYRQSLVRLLRRVVVKRGR